MTLSAPTPTTVGKTAPRLSQGLGSGQANTRSQPATTANVQEGHQGVHVSENPARELENGPDNVQSTPQSGQHRATGSDDGPDPLSGLHVRLAALDAASTADRKNGAQSGPDTSANDKSTQAIDETLTDALRSSRDRLFLLKQERDMIDFVKDDAVRQLALPLMNSYQRLLVHRCADYFGLSRDVDAETKAVTLTKTERTHIPAKRLVQVFNEVNAALRPTDLSPFAVYGGHSRSATDSSPQSGQCESVKHVVTLAPSSGTAAAAAGEVSAVSSMPASSSTSGSGGPSPTPAAGFRIMRRDPSIVGSASRHQTPPLSGGGSTSATGGVEMGKKSRREMTIEEREAAYKEARERIFGSTEAESPNGAATPPKSTVRATTSRQSDGDASTCPPTAAGGLSRAATERRDTRRDRRTETAVQAAPTLSRGTSYGQSGHLHAQNGRVTYQQPSESTVGAEYAAPAGAGPQLQQHDNWTVPNPQHFLPASGRMENAHAGMTPSVIVQGQSQYQAPWQPHHYPQQQHYLHSGSTQGFVQPSTGWPGQPMAMYSVPFYPGANHPAHVPSHPYPHTGFSSQSVYSVDSFSPFPPTPSNISSSGTGSVGMPSPAPSVVSSSSASAISQAPRDYSDDRRRSPAWSQHMAHGGQYFHFQNENGHVSYGPSNHELPSASQNQYLNPQGPLAAAGVTPHGYNAYGREQPNRSATSSPLSSISNQRSEHDTSNGQPPVRQRRAMQAGVANGSAGRLNIGERMLFDPNGNGSASSPTGASPRGNAIVPSASIASSPGALVSHERGSSLPHSSAHRVASLQIRSGPTAPANMDQRSPAASGSSSSMAAAATRPEGDVPAETWRQVQHTDQSRPADNSSTLPPTMLGSTIRLGSMTPALISPAVAPFVPRSTAVISGPTTAPVKPFVPRSRSSIDGSATFAPSAGPEDGSASGSSARVATIGLPPKPHWVVPPTSTGAPPATSEHGSVHPMAFFDTPQGSREHSVGGSIDGSHGGNASLPFIGVSTPRTARLAAAALPDGAARYIHSEALPQEQLPFSDGLNMIANANVVGDSSESMQPQQLEVRSQDDHGRLKIHPSNITTATAAAGLAPSPSSSSSLACVRRSLSDTSLNSHGRMSNSSLGGGGGTGAGRRGSSSGDSCSSLGPSASASNVGDFQDED